MPKAFISYARLDTKIVGELEQILTGRGIAVWHDQHGIYGGQQWPKIIGEAIADCDVVLLLWSAHSAASHFVEFEWTTALALRKTIIPCLLDETKLPPSLAAINGLTCRNLTEALPRILTALSGQRRPHDEARRAQVVTQLQRVTTTEPAEALAQARALFNQGSLHAGGHIIQSGGDVTINGSRHHITLLIAALAAVVIITLAAFYFYIVSRTGPTPPQPAPSPTVEETTYLRGQVEDGDGNPISGATVKIDEITGKPPMQTTTTSSGGFIINKIPARSGDRVRVYVSKEGYVTLQGEEKHDQYVTLPGPLPTIELRRKK
jgi:hypothetical protein